MKLRLDNLLEFLPLSEFKYLPEFTIIRYGIILFVVVSGCVIAVGNYFKVMRQVYEKSPYTEAKVLRTLDIVLTVLFLASPFLMMVWCVVMPYGIHYDKYGDHTLTITEYSGGAEKLKIPSRIFMFKVANIGPEVFKGNTNLREVTLPPSVYIYNESFAGCPNLERINFGEGVTVSWSAFEGCTALESLSFTEGMTVGKSAFAGCTGLKNLAFADGMIIKESAFADCTGLERLAFAEGMSVGESAFSYCTNVREVAFADGVSVYENAFEGCAAWKSATFSNNIKMGDSSFSQSGLEVVAFEGNVEVGPSAFLSCDNLKAVTLHEGAKVGSGAFAGCTALESVTFAKGVELGFSAFRRCTSLKDVTFMDGMTIGYYAFAECSDLESATFADNMSIEQFAFADCNNLAEVTGITENTRIETGAFLNTYWLHHRPEDFVILGDHHYIYLGNQRAVTIPEGILTADFFMNKTVERIVLPESLTYFQHSCFQGCSSLTDLNFPKEISFESYCLGGTPLTRQFRELYGDNENFYDFEIEFACEEYVSYLPDEEFIASCRS